jgi:hypothetical protein
MVALAECLEDHGDDINLLYLTDSEAILQAIHRWIGCGAKLNLSKSPDVDVLKRIILKLQKRVLAGVVTLLVIVKAHRGNIELLAKRNHQGQGVQQVRPLQSSMDSRREIQHGRRTPYQDPRTHTTPM